MRRITPLLLALLALTGSACGTSEAAQAPASTTPASVENGGAMRSRAATETGDGAGEATASTGGAQAVAPSGVSSAPFVWEVRAGDRVSHLFGTMHVGVSLERALPEAQRARLLGARVVVVAADPAPPGPQAASQAMMLPPDRSLRDMVGPEVWPRLAAALGAEMPAAVLERLRPWAVSVAFVQHWVNAHLADAPARGMDLAVIDGARSRAQQLLFLEEAQSQLDIIGRIPDAYFVDVLGEMVSDEAEAERQIGGLVSSYLRGDLPAVEAIVFDPEDMRTSPEYYDLFLYRRNAAWLTQLEPLFREEGGAFVAVGLAHMLGPQGLVEALRAKGFTVTRVAGRQ